MKKYLIISGNILGVLAAAIWILITTTSLEINNKFIMIFLIIWAVYTLFFGIISLLNIKINTNQNRILSFGATMTGVVIHLFTGGNNEWKSQIIEYQNLHFNNKTIEYQQMNLGDGYKKRRVERTKIASFVDWIKLYEPIKKPDSLTWKRMDINLTEQDLKEE